jgi:hypothetical protein
MGQGVSTGERLEMVPAKAGNYTLLVVVVDDIHLWVTRIEFLCLVYFPHHYLMLPQCPQGVVRMQTTNPLEPYWLSSVEILSSTFYVNPRCW